MPRKLTDDRISKLKPKARQYSVSEPTIPGLELRVSPHGQMSWSLRYRNDEGKQLRRTLGTWPDMNAEAARGTVGAKQPEHCRQNQVRLPKVRKQTRLPQTVSRSTVLTHCGKTSGRVAGIVVA